MDGRAALRWITVLLLVVLLAGGWVDLAVQAGQDSAGGVEPGAKRCRQLQPGQQV